MSHDADAQRANYMRRRRQSAIPVHSSSRRSYEQLRASIRSGSIVDEALVEPQLIRAFGTSRNSMRRSLQMLARDGLISRSPRVGTALTGEIVDIPILVTRAPGAGSVSEADVEALSDDEPEHLEVRELGQWLVPTPSVFTERLRLSAPTILMVEHLGLYKGEPLFVRVAYLPLLPTPGVRDADADADADAGAGAGDGAAEHPDAGHDSSDATAENFERLFSARLGHTSASIEAIPCEEETARLLGVEPGSPILLREMILLDSETRAREYSFTHFRGDRVALSR